MKLKIQTNKNLYDKFDCIPISDGINLTGDLLVLKPEFLLSPYNVREYQLVLCREDNGHGLLIEFIFDGETTRDYIREDFLGIIKPWFVPKWAYLVQKGWSLNRINRVLTAKEDM